MFSLNALFGNRTRQTVAYIEYYIEPLVSRTVFSGKLLGKVSVLVVYHFICSKAFDSIEASTGACDYDIASDSFGHLYRENANSACSAIYKHSVARLGLTMFEKRDVGGHGSEGNSRSLCEA